jgi:uncharacterized protein
LTAKPVLRHAFGLLLILAAAVTAVYAAGSAAIWRAPVAALSLPVGLPVERVSLNEPGRPKLEGWLAQGSGKCGAVLLLHGRGSNKGAMAERARMLHEKGLSVVLFDLPGHGESGGDIKGFGFGEIEAVARMATLLHQRFPGQRIGAIGSSLGAASLVLAHDEFKADAYVVESMFATLEQTTAQRMRIPFLRSLQAKIMLAQLPFRMGFSADDVRPVMVIGKMTSPILILTGAGDQLVDSAQTSEIFDAITAPKKLVTFDGIGHQDLRAFDEEKYDREVLPFFTHILCQL